MLFKERCQALEVNERTYRWNVEKSKECKMCRASQVESVYHVIVEYTRYEGERDELMNVVIEEWPMGYGVL